MTQPGVITLQALAASQTTVSLSVEDMHNPAVGISFMVTVTEANQPPQLPAHRRPGANAGNRWRSTTARAIRTAIRCNTAINAPNIVEASVTQPGVITLQGVAAGQASVTLAVTDGVNPEVSVTFGVLVESAIVPQRSGESGRSQSGRQQHQCAAGVADADSVR